MQEIFAVEACEELEKPTWTASGACEETHSVDLVAVASSVEMAYEIMRKKKNFIKSPNRWHFRLTKFHMDDPGDEEVVELFINPAIL